MEELVKEIFKPPKFKGERRDVKCFYPIDLYTADLVDYQRDSSFNEGYKFVLTCVDCYSRYAFTVPVKSKFAKDIVPALRSIFEKGTPTNLWTDDGGEFKNREVKRLYKRYKVNRYITNTGMKAIIDERFNRTLRNKIGRNTTARKTREYLSVLQELTDEYNNEPHSFLNGETPHRVFNGEANYPIKANVSLLPPKFEVGDTVRTIYKRGTFDKGYYPNWSWQTFKIIDIENKSPHFYTLLYDENKPPLKRKFYEWELLKSNSPFGLYIIDEVLSYRENEEGELEARVKWIGYKDPTWIPAKDLKEPE